MEQRSKIRELVYVFRELKRALHQVVSKQAEKEGTTDIQFYVLSALRRNPELGMSELAELLHLGNSTLSGVIDRMEKSGLVDRRRSAADRRAITLHLTKEGEAAEERISLLYNEAISRLDVIPEADLDHLMETLRLIISLIEEKEGE